MNRLVGILLACSLSACTQVGCATTGGSLSLPASPIIPYDAGIIIGSRSLDSSGSACVVAPTLAVTAAHVVHAKDQQLEWFHTRLRVGGMVHVFAFNGPKDLATISPDEGVFPVVAPIAKEAPVAGEEVRIIGMMEHFQTIFTGHVLGVEENGALILDAMIYPGTSGGCIFNMKGEVIGVAQRVEWVPGMSPGQRGWSAGHRLWGLVVEAPPVKEKEVPSEAPSGS